MRKSGEKVDGSATLAHVLGVFPRVSPRGVPRARAPMINKWIYRSNIVESCGNMDAVKTW